MKRLSTAALLSVLVACQSGSITEPTTNQTAAAVTGGECNVEDTFVPPTLSLTDLQIMLGKVVFYTSSLANLSQLFDGSWTNWYKAGDLDTAIAKLAAMRSVLDQYNLYDTYLPGTRSQVDCTDKSSARQADGTCNDLASTTAGAAGARIGRNISLFIPNPAGPGAQPPYIPNPAAYPATTDAELLTPNPRLVSRTLFSRDANGMKPVPFLNLLAASWIQFMIHDWFSHGDNSSTESFHVALATDDPLRRLGLTELVIPKTTRDTTAAGQPLPPVYKNEVTHWWDGSQLYGSSKAASDALRAHRGTTLLAELAVDGHNMLPVDSDGYEKTGMRRNFWVGLGLMHNTFAREHNAIVAKLRQTHPELGEEALFDKARLINAAVMAKIHTVEWTPAILPNRTATTGLYANWYGLKAFLDPASQAALPQFMAGMAQQIIATSPDPATAQARIATAKAAVLGVVGGDTDNHGVPYSLTEEFVSVYRMHELLPDSIVIKSTNGRTLLEVPTAGTRLVAGRVLENRFGLANLAYSFGVAHPGALVLGNYPKFIQELILPAQSGHGLPTIVDMGAIDVLRDRERGIPRYNDFRKQLRLPPVASIEDLTPDPALQAALHKIYGNDVGAIDRLDATVGTLAEATRPSCYGFGETLFQVFTEMATRRLQADRFYTKDFNAATYTAEGMQWISDASFKAILLRQYPELANTGLAVSQNAFYPWE